MMHNTRIEEKFIQLLVDNRIDYRVVQSQTDQMTVLIHSRFYELFCKKIRNTEYKKIPHPFGKLYQYQFLYQMKEFQLFRKGCYLIEVFFELPCMSLTPKTWIPLDKTIQNSIWIEKDGKKYLDKLNTYVFKLTWAIFMRKAFDKEVVLFFETNRDLINDKLQEKLYPIFFKYTNVLIQLLRDGKYQDIRQQYITFKNY
jgi:hypothetical protein